MQVCALDPSGRLSISLDTEHCLLELEAGHLMTSSPRHVRDTVGVRSSTLDTRRGRHGGNTPSRGIPTNAEHANAPPHRDVLAHIVP